MASPNCSHEFDGRGNDRRGDSRQHRYRIELETRHHNVSADGEYSMPCEKLHEPCPRRPGRRNRRVGGSGGRRRGTPQPIHAGANAPIAHRDEGETANDAKGPPGPVGPEG